MSVAEAADAPIPQRPASAVGALVLVAAGLSAPAMVQELYSTDPRYLHRPGLVLGVAVVSVMLLGVTKRAFRGFDRGSLAALLATVALGRFTWNWVSGEGITGPLHGAVVALLAIVLGTWLARRAEDGQSLVQRARRSAAMVGWTALVTVGFATVAPRVAAAVYDHGVYWMPFFGAAFACGACLLAGLLLGITSLFREPW